jgi:uncharacterized protein (DUF2126 family)
METDDIFAIAVRHHDARIAELGLPIWVGSEPTFTDRQAQTPAWLRSALGDDKESRAQALLYALSGRMPGGVLLRSVGRLYPGEKVPRWNMGLLRRRNGAPLWAGPPDPMVQAAAALTTEPDIAELARALSDALAKQSWGTQCAQTTNEDGNPIWKVSTRIDDTPQQSLDFLILPFACPVEPTDQPMKCAAIELPVIDSVETFLSVLSCIEKAALGCNLHALVFTGATPPVNAALELTTVTPDPAVIEVNTAPSANCTEFLWRSQQIYAAAAEQGLSPFRLYFNGQVADSGGAGQITFGGPTPQDSPFVKNATLLPKLVRFLNRHPAMSYLFSHDFVGGSGQSVRTDERGTDALDDLKLALALLERKPDVSPELLWKSLASFLCDTVGNSHRAEINIEKLWNPFLPGRGCLGLVEFRSLRMQHTPQRATSVACLFRAVIAMLASRPYDLPLIDWGRELHDRFSLPFYLRLDLHTVFNALDEVGLGLDAPIRDALLQNEFRFFGKVDLPFGTLELWRGLEFWPLVGDAASPEQSGSSRMVDASTTRIEMRWLPPPEDMTDRNAQGHWLDWNLYVDEVRLPLRHELDDRGALQVFGVRYNSFIPRSGLHPTLEIQAPLTLKLRHQTHSTEYVVKLHEWQPEGEAYPGLPTDLTDARARRAARVTVQAQERPVQDHSSQSSLQAIPPVLGLSAYSLDLRYH